MGYIEISVRASKTRDVAEKVKNQTSETPNYSDDLGDYLDENVGNARNKLFEVNSNTEICVNVTRQLIECTSRFLFNAADTFGEVDYTIAKEVLNS